MSAGNGHVALTEPITGVVEVGPSTGYVHPKGTSLGPPAIGPVYSQPVVSETIVTVLLRQVEDLQAWRDRVEASLELHGVITDPDKVAARKMLKRDEQRRELGHEELAMLRKVAGV